MIIELKNGLMEDLPSTGNPGLVTATDCLPMERGFLPTRGRDDAYTDGFSEEVKGIAGISYNDLNYVYAGGSSKLQSINVVGPNVLWFDVTPSGGLNSPDLGWEFVQWKNKVIATNYADYPQTYDHGIADTFFSDLTTDLKFRHIAVARNHVIGGYVNDGSEVPYRVRWCADGDETDWTVSATTLAGSFDLPSRAGQVVGVQGGEYAIVFCTHSIWRMTYIGAPAVWQFDEIKPGLGCLLGGSIAQYGSDIYFVSTDGPKRLRDGAVLDDIGDGKIDRTLLGIVQRQEQYALTTSRGAIDPERHLYIFGFLQSGQSAIETCYAYNWLSANWTNGFSDLDADIIFSIPKFGSGTNKPVFGEVDSTDHKIYFRESGTIASAVLETGDFQLSQSRRTSVNRVRVLGDSGSTTLRVGQRNKQSDSVSYEAGSISSSGSHTGRWDARYHRFEITGNSSVADPILGIEIEHMRPSGRY